MYETLTKMIKHGGKTQEILCIYTMHKSKPIGELYGMQIISLYKAVILKSKSVTMALVQMNNSKYKRILFYLRKDSSDRM